jgi:hypothetical protein
MRHRGKRERARVKTPRTRFRMTEYGRHVPGGRRAKKKSGAGKHCAGSRSRSWAAKPHSVERRTCSSG